MLSRFSKNFASKSINRSFASIHDRFAEVLPQKREQIARIKKNHSNKVSSTFLMRISILAKLMSLVVSGRYWVDTEDQFNTILASCS
jgi:hypothetical protein